MPTPAYRNPALSVDERVADLLGRMTLEEKVGQLLMLDARGEDLSFINARQPGSLLHILGGKIDRAMDLAAKNRLGIPLLIGEDGIHGHSFWKDANIFPTQLAMAASWNPELLEKVGRVTAEEMAPTGIHETFSPVLCLTRDLRWGRTGETFGEDPYLIGELGAALIRGYQGKGLGDPTGVLATAKHYAGYSETQGGRDASEADISRRKLRSYFLPPFERAVRAGAMMFMTGYQSMDGVPSTANRWLLTDVLKNEWGFKGVLVTDWDNVGRLVNEQKVAATYADAAIMALRAGNDIMMTTPRFYEGAIEAVRSGRLEESEIDAPVKRLLALKFRMGLFENPRRPDLAKAAVEVARPDHRAAVLAAARQSLVLLQNDGLLPLDPAKVKSIAVVGPNADDDLQQLGDWSLGSPQHPPEAGKHPRERTVTVLDGIKALAPAGTAVRYEKGCSIVNDDLSGVPAAVAAAQAADVVVAVVGDHLNFIGEEKSTATLELQGGQVALLDALGEDRQADGRRARQQQAARAAAVGQACRGDPRGLQPRHGGRTRHRRGRLRPAEPVGQAHDLVPGSCRPAAGLLQPGARPARRPLRRPHAGAALPVRPRPELHDVPLLEPAPRLALARPRAGGGGVGRRRERRRARRRRDRAGLRQRRRDLGDLGEARPSRASPACTSRPARRRRCRSRCRGRRSRSWTPRAAASSSRATSRSSSAPRPATATC